MTTVEMVKNVLKFSLSLSRVLFYEARCWMVYRRIVGRLRALGLDDFDIGDAELRARIGARHCGANFMEAFERAGERIAEKKGRVRW